MTSNRESLLTREEIFSCGAQARSGLTDAGIEGERDLAHDAGLDIDDRGLWDRVPRCLFHDEHVGPGPKRRAEPSMLVALDALDELASAPPRARRRLDSNSSLPWLRRGTARGDDRAGRPDQDPACDARERRSLQPKGRGRCPAPRPEEDGKIGRRPASRWIRWRAQCEAQLGHAARLEVDSLSSPSAREAERERSTLSLQALAHSRTRARQSDSSVRRHATVEADSGGALEPEMPAPSVGPGVVPVGNLRWGTAGGRRPTRLPARGGALGPPRRGQDHDRDDRDDGGDSCRHVGGSSYCLTRWSAASAHQLRLPASAAIGGTSALR
jgi:hypothetical protein